MRHTIPYRFVSLLLGSVLTGALGGCAVGTEWEDYELSHYQDLRVGTPETADAHFRLLRNTLQEARVQGVRPPPGVRIELACRQAKRGNERKAATLLLQEERDYPESATLVALVRGMISRGQNPLVASGRRRPGAGRRLQSQDDPRAGRGGL